MVLFSIMFINIPLLSIARTQERILEAHPLEIVYKIKEEIRLVRSIKNRSLRSKLARNLKQVYLDQIRIIGNYSQRILRRQEQVLEKSMVGMSYINLEIIKKLKKEFFEGTGDSKKIGDIKNLKRDSGQYLWDFNGEFWADELGDYVFSLKSSCG